MNALKKNNVNLHFMLQRIFIKTNLLSYQKVLNYHTANYNPIESISL